ncbi:hypothetical protein K0M31_014725 [Melipona bicolor]|uniref:CCDC113/CCDC96 coiled-coil domain-containing protein n=1 Tax=Melipona bicolor TaxID=60889 RepID=A0AA40KFZ5_9HYME|nr:hypothetical protein K0M31_014725 [Melipona bicolor]
MTPPPQRGKLTFGVVLEHDDDKIPKYKFDMSHALDNVDETNDFGFEGEEEDDRVEAVDSERDEESVWDVVSGLLKDDRYEEEEAGEGEEMPPSIVSVSTVEEEIEREPPSPEVIEHVPVEIPPEVLDEREPLIDKLKELLAEKSELSRKNRLLELWITRNMKKIQQRMTPADPAKTREQMEEVYKEALREYKIQVDEILTRQDELADELQSYTARVRALSKEDDQIYQEFLDRQKEISVGLIFSKTGRKLTEKMMDNLTRRQATRRVILAQDRRNYVLLQHRLDSLNVQLKIAETLGEGMTAMDYETLHIANLGYKDRLDERDRELEKLRNKYASSLSATFRYFKRLFSRLLLTRIAETVNGVAQYKEKEVCIVDDIEFEQINLDHYRGLNTEIRERVNIAHVALNEVRETLNEKNIAAGLLVSQQALMQMQKMITMKEELANKIKMIEQEIELYKPTKQTTKKSQLSRTTLS